MIPCYVWQRFGLWTVESSKYVDYTFIMDTQVDIEKTLRSQKCSQCLNMLKSDISGHLGGPLCKFLTDPV